MEFSEVERSIEFLLAQRAQFMSDLQQSRELSDRRHAEISQAIIGLSAIGGMLAESDRQLSRRLAELATAQKETESSLNALLLTVERHLREQRGDDPRHPSS